MARIIEALTRHRLGQLSWIEAAERGQSTGRPRLLQPFVAIVRVPPLLMCAIRSAGLRASTVIFGEGWRLGYGLAGGASRSSRTSVSWRKNWVKDNSAGWPGVVQVSFIASLPSFVSSP